MIGDATGQDYSFVEQDREANARIVELMHDGLSVQDAVRICLINNPTLLAAFRNVGIARADVVQSGLFSNPTLGLAFTFPEGGGRSKIDLGFAQNIVDLWQIPVRRRAAQAALDQAILNLAATAAGVVSDTKVAYFGAVANAQILEITEENLSIAKQLQEIAEDRERAGAVSGLDVNLARGSVLATQIQVRNARLDLNNAKRRLAVLLGLAERAESLVLADPFPTPPQAPVNADQMLEIALQSRFDVQAAEKAVSEAELRVREEYRKVVPSIELGLAFERQDRRSLGGRKILADTARASVAAGQLTAPEIQSRGQRDQERRQEIDALLGPAIDLTLPVFDQNQAQIAKAKYQLEQAEQSRIGLVRALFHDVHKAVDAAETAWEVARLYEREVVPQAQATLDMSRETYRAGKASINVMLSARSTLLEARQGYVTALQNAASAVAELERQTARPFSSAIAPSSQPIAPRLPAEGSSNGDKEP